MTLTVNYTAKWQLKSNPKYKWTTCKKLINCQTGNEIKKTIKGASAGYYIGKDFIKLEDLKSQIELIPKKEYTPF